MKSLSVQRHIKMRLDIVFICMISEKLLMLNEKPNLFGSNTFLHKRWQEKLKL